MEVISRKIINSLKSSDREIMENAFNTIYKEYSYLVFYVALKIIKNNDLAKEITNEVFTSFYLHKDNIKDDKNLKYYLVSSSKNLSITYLNKQNKMVELNDNYSYTSNLDDYSSYINKFKELLEEDEIELVVYHLIYGFKFKEIAKMKNNTIDSITSKYKRTLVKIKKHYKEEDL